MKLVSEPTEGEDCFNPEAAIAFYSHPQRSQYASVPMAVSCSDGLLSPYSPTFLHRSMSLGSRGLDSPALSDASLQSPHPLSGSSLPPSPRPLSATSSLTSAMKDMHFPIPRQSEKSLVTCSCPIAPAAFSLWADDPHSDEAMHVFARLADESLAGPSGTLHLEDLPLSELRFPGLVNMNDHLPCRFIHVKINLDIPAAEGGLSSTEFKTQLTLTSLQDLNLTSVTSIYSYGTQVLSLEEDLAPPTRIESNPNAGSPSVTISPTTSNSALQHKFSHNAPFASDFWSIFLQGAFSPEVEGAPHIPSFSKTGAERSEFSMAISGLSVIQEFVVRAEEPVVPANHSPISPGSVLGDVVLVITYDFECQESPSSGKAQVSYLAVRKPAPLPTRVPSVRMQPNFLSINRTTSTHSLGEMAPRMEQHQSRGGHHQSKPSLSLHIPPPPSFAGTSGGVTRSPGMGPITPWPQLIHTPNAPPPVHTASATSPTQRGRLQTAWARDSNDWECSSPALMGVFPYTPAATSTPNYSQAMSDLTTRAIAAGTPTFPTFPSEHQLSYPPHAHPHGTFHIHPSHLLAPPSVTNRMQYATQRSVPMAGRSVSGPAVMQQQVKGEDPIAPSNSLLFDTCGSFGSNAREDEKAVKEIEAQDYFTGLLGASSKYSAGGMYPAPR